MSQDAAPVLADSVPSSGEHVAPSTPKGSVDRSVPPGHEESTLPDGKIEEAWGDENDDWEHDPDNARNWSFGRKWTAVAIVSLYTFVSPLASSMMAPGLEQVAIQYGITSSTIGALTLSIYLLSFALGPLILAPLSEMYGRTNITETLSPDSWVLWQRTYRMRWRDLWGLVFGARSRLGNGCLQLGSFDWYVPSPFPQQWHHDLDTSSTIDQVRWLDPSLVDSLHKLLALNGSSSPLLVRTQSSVARWLADNIAQVLAGLTSLLGIPLLRETYGPVIRLRKAMATGDPEAVSRIYRVANIRKNPGVGGLAYIGLGVGFLLATLFGAKTADQVYKYLADKNGGVGKPEMRIPALFFGSFFVPIGLFWYGWSAQAKIHWIMPIIGTGIFGFGLMCSFLPIQLYLVDAFRFAASATAAASVFRSMLGFAFPLFGQQMFDSLGLGGGNSVSTLPGSAE
ncbi:hypothetical protein C0991_009654 [Blastosporella zonata]|nr:hypothetical protein C0991_009654 [Blastosporella zonata]